MTGWQARCGPSRRGLLAGAGTLLLPAGAAGRAATAEGPLRIVGPWEISGLEPASSGHFFTGLQVAQTLVDADDTGRLRPGLAAAWQVAEEGLSWRLTLRAGVQFHDGSPLTATSVARALQRAHGRPGLLRLAPLTAVDPEGPLQLRLRLSRPFALLPALLAHPSTLVLAPASLGAGGGVERIIGTGPYRVAALAAPQRVQVQAADPASPWPVRRAHYLQASRAETRALMAEAGQADLAIGLDPASLARLRGHPAVRVLQVMLPRTLILKPHCGHRWLADLRARQALSLALDRAGIAAGLLRDPTLAAGQLLPPLLKDWHQPALPALRHDPGQARALWAQLGWRPGPDGILQRGQERLRLTLRTFPDRPELPLVAAAVQEQLRLTGVDCRVLVGNASELPLRHRDGSLELSLAARHYALVPDPLGTLLQDFGPEGGDWGALGWHSPALQQALDALSRGKGDAARWRRQAVTALHEGLPVIPLAWYRHSVAVPPALAGLSLDPLERSWRLTEMAWPRPVVS
ncbi:ABC transporter substrate-binding protein [Ideonella sp. TBM-1]|uniref:ABC transporter substrate-binding protein n=1 Tax=Ideonella livida TaxID=2707176 RepID=A0A7C9PJ89_9BURK|nr:ABC transporter substrate-binding protein [Ideonella livida]